MPMYNYGGLSGSSVVGQVFATQQMVASSNGQTAFALAQPKLGGGMSSLMVNGITYEEGIHYTIVGIAMTWLDVGFTLQVGDQLQVYYQIA